jgi:hypothetical protein
MKVVGTPTTTAAIGASVAWWLVGIVGLVTTTTATTTTTTRTQQQQECGIYLAPSTIPGAGLGLFAGNRPYAVGDLVSPPDQMIMVYDMDWHNGNDHYSFLWDEYTWASGRW